MVHRLGERRLLEGGSSNAAAVAGYPDITVPAGFILWFAGGSFVLRSGVE